MAKDLAATKDATPNDTTIKEKLMNDNLYKNRNLCKYLLSIIENGVNVIKEVVQIDFNTTIEHIMPQNKDSEEWRNHIGQNYDFIYDKYLHTLGNLSLTGYNSELSDKPFMEKVSMIREKSKFVILNQDVVDKTCWNDKTIVSRSDRLSSKLLQELKLPSIFGKKINTLNNEPHKVYNVEDFTGMKINSFIFLGENVEVESGREMLIKFVEMLYVIDPERLHNMAANDWKSANATCPLLTYDYSKLRSYSEILNSGIYIEKNRSLNDVVRSIKYLMEEFDIELDEFVFYTTPIQKK